MNAPASAVVVTRLARSVTGFSATAAANSDVRVIVVTGADESTHDHEVDAGEQFIAWNLRQRAHGPFEEHQWLVPGPVGVIFAG